MLVNSGFGSCENSSTTRAGTDTNKDAARAEALYLSLRLASRFRQTGTTCEGRTVTKVCSWRVKGPGERFWWGSLNTDHLEDLGMDGSVILQKYDGRAQTGFVWLGTELSGGLL